MKDIGHAHWLTLLVAVLFLLGCTEQGQAQHENVIEGQRAAQELSLARHCKELSAENKYEYQVVSGEVIRTGIVPPQPAECDRREDDCSWLSETAFFAVMKPLRGEGVFTAYTKREQQEELSKKEPYMLEGKRYAFCARRLDEASKYHNEQNVYRIDYIQTIKQIQ